MIDPMSFMVRELAKPRIPYNPLVERKHAEGELTQAEQSVRDLWLTGMSYTKIGQQLGYSIVERKRRVSSGFSFAQTCPAVNGIVISINKKLALKNLKDRSHASL